MKRKSRESLHRWILDRFAWHKGDSLVVHVEGPSADCHEEVWYTYLTVHDKENRVRTIVEACPLGVHSSREEAWQRAQKLASFFKARVEFIDPETDILLGY